MIESARPRARAVLAATCALLAIGVPAARADRTPVPADGPSEAQGAIDQGATPAAATQVLRVYLAPRGGLATLKDDVEQISTPGSATYGQFLTRRQFMARYRPAAADVRSVATWLRSQGLKVIGAEPSDRYLTVTGPASAAEQAFGTPLHSYSTTDQSFQAPTQTPTVPDSVRAKVIAVSGLATRAHTFAPGATPDQSFPPPDAFVNGRPCSNSYGALSATYQADFQTPLPKFGGKKLPYAPCGYQPQQLRGAYEGSTDLTGSGVTVGIVDAYAAPTILADANQYATRHGDPAFAGGGFTQRNAAPFTHADECDPSGWYGEETLDVEAVHAMATGANVRYYGAKSCFNSDIADTLDTVVDENKVSIVSNSYGSTEGDETPDDVAATQQAFLQGAMQGISFLFSSGDNGDEVANTGVLQADYPASNPYITAVGGTSLGIGAGQNLIFQTGWGTQKYSLSANGKSWTPVGYLYGSGGGYSSLFNRPSYQTKVVPATAPAGRAVPDVALDADPTTGMLIGETQQFPSGPAYGEYRIGGTSLASPLMAGFQALSQQHQGSRQGFLNPQLYQSAKSNPSLFLDIAKAGPDAGNVRADYANGLDPSDGVLYSVRTFNQDSSLAVTKGWDPVTGIGSPSPKYLTDFAVPPPATR